MHPGGYFAWGCFRYFGWEPVMTTFYSAAQRTISKLADPVNPLETILGHQWAKLPFGNAHDLP